MSQNAQQVPAGGTTPSEQTPGYMSPLVISTQYIKDMSIVVPQAPLIHARMPKRPQVAVALDVLVRPMPEVTERAPVFEVTLTVKCNATAPSDQPEAQADSLYQLSLGYAGIFSLASVPQNAFEPVLLAECPRLLFPFARSLVAEITRDAGFAPAMLQPIDFFAFWQSKRQQAAQAAGQVPGEASGEASGEVSGQGAEPASATG